MKRLTAIALVLVLATALCIPCAGAVTASDRDAFNNWVDCLNAHMRELVATYKRTGTLSEAELRDLSYMEIAILADNAVTFGWRGDSESAEDCVQLAEAATASYNNYKAGTMTRDAYLNLLISIAEIIIGD